MATRTQPQTQRFSRGLHMDVTSRVTVRQELGLFGTQLETDSSMRAQRRYTCTVDVRVPQTAVRTNEA